LQLCIVKSKHIAATIRHAYCRDQGLKEKPHLKENIRWKYRSSLEKGLKSVASNALQLSKPGKNNRKKQESNMTYIHTFIQNVQLDQVSPHRLKKI
jgi:hypothetical protein